MVLILLLEMGATESSVLSWWVFVDYKNVRKSAFKRPSFEILVTYVIRLSLPIIGLIDE